MIYIFKGPANLGSDDFKPYIGREIGIVSRVRENGETTHYRAHFGIPEAIDNGIRVVDKKTLSWGQTTDLTKTTFHLRANQELYLE